MSRKVSPEDRAMSDFIHALNTAYSQFMAINKGKSPDDDALAFIEFVVRWLRT